MYLSIFFNKNYIIKQKVDMVTIEKMFLEFVLLENVDKCKNFLSENVDGGGIFSKTKLF